MEEGVYDVAIVGFGPTGAVAAALLGGTGLRVLVCDRSHDIYDKPRAFALDHEIMRVFQQLGVADDVMEFAEPFTPSEFYGVDRQLIKRFTTVDPPFPLAFPPSLVFSQPDLERILRAHVEALPSVDVALGITATALSQDAQAATLTVKRADGTERSVRARYVIGCDGASSTVRALVDLPLKDLGFDQPWLVVDVMANDSGVQKLPKVSMQVCEPQRPTTYLVGVKNHRRWEIALNEDDPPGTYETAEGVWKLLSRWITPEDGTLWRHARYRFHALVAERWREGRIFIAGDAAHQQPPFLGQGMCQGVRDAANISWKLQAVLNGSASDALLDTYGTERGGHVTELTNRIKHIGQLVGERDLGKARERDAQLLAACNGVVPSQPRQSVQPALANGLLSTAVHSAVGTIFPQPWVRNGAGRVRMDEVAGRGWRLVCAANDWAAQVAEFLPLDIVHIGKTPYEEVDGVTARWFADQACVAAIVRPDHYVWGVASTAQELQSQLALLEQQMDPRRQP